MGVVMKPLQSLATLLLVFGLCATSLPAEAARRPCPQAAARPKLQTVGWRWVRVPIRRAAHVAKPRVRHRLRAGRYRRPARRSRVRRAATPHTTYVFPQVAGSEPLYLGDLFISSANTALLSRPDAAAMVLARLPKRTDVVNMGRILVLGPTGRVTHLFYKVEAPNGKVGYVDARWLSPNPPEW